MKYIYQFIVILILSFISKCQQHEENFAILLSTSKFWFNYRQATNIMMMYQTLKTYGYSDENILVLIPENTACNPRNVFPGIISPYDNNLKPNLFREIEVDYKHSDVEVKSFFNILRGRYHKYLPHAQRVPLSKKSNVLVYFTGHGGDSYIKMQDTDVIFDEDLDRILQESYSKKLYKEMAMFSDSCSAATLFYKLTSPNIFAVGSSSFDEKSYSYGHDSILQMSKTDRFSLNNYKYFHQNFKKNRNLKFADIFKTYTYKYLKGHYETINTMPNKNATDIYLKDFWTQKKTAQIRGNNYFEQVQRQENNNKDSNNQDMDEVYQNSVLEALNLEIQNLQISTDSKIDLSTVRQV